MDNSAQLKRKCEEGAMDSENKKQHSELEFSASQVSAESTIINDTDNLEDVVSDYNSLENSTFNDDDQNLVETVVAVVNKDVDSLHETVNILQIQMKEKEKLIHQLRTEKCQLQQQLSDLERNSKSLKEDNKLKDKTI